MKRSAIAGIGSLLLLFVLSACDDTTATETATEEQIPEGFVRIPRGTFIMGDESKTDAIQHQVTLSSFLIGKYEVTQKEYEEVIGSNPSSANQKGDNLPVEKVSWYDAIEYCNALSVKEGLTPAYQINKNEKDPNSEHSSDTLKWIVSWNRNANGYRLPTEAEWEYACRAGTTTPYYYSGHPAVDAAWYSVNSDNVIHPVGEKLVNPWGLYDMFGNVREWCWDWYGTYPAEAQINPTGAGSSQFRVIRGGSRSNNESFLYSAARNCQYPSFQGVGVGFRLVRSSLNS